MESSTERTERQRTDVDRGWAWVVLAGSFLIKVIIMYNVSSFSVFYAYIASEFGSSNSITAGVGAVLSGLGLVLGPFSACLAAVYGIRNIVIVGGCLTTLGLGLSYRSPTLLVFFPSYSLLAGMGMGLAFTPSVAIAGYYFDKQRPLATVIASFGVPIGGILGPIVTLKLIEMYTWQGALLVMGGLNLHIVFAGALFRPLPAVKPKYGIQNKKAANLTRDQIMKLVPHGAGIFCKFAVQNIVAAFVVEYGVELGIEISMVTKLVAIKEASSTFMRISLIILSQMRWFNILIAYNVGLIILAISCLSLFLLDAPMFFLVSLGLYGFGRGLTSALLSAVNAELYGVENLLIVEGISACCGGCANLIGLTASGALADHFGSTRPAFLFSAFLGLTGALLFAGVFVIHRRSRKDGARNGLREYQSAP
ncbi:PREDICTED: monocarboxylate transporter 12-B-like [Priapulus caudatus]|uniref:Monocarboxylate transporter 12-B-like n=1 Tax=Priapulus caudatus TaxID=37621 RepID=A0ABM1EBF5_PRICU|nr:PREDICTED: monocarboxylate transporter 12-B-like [Priapulus caudatus]